VPSSSLIPENDPSVMLTTAGMQQFKPYFTGQKDPLKDFGSQRTCSVQKSFRTTDIELVGDESHLTFFEMLGNFSFGPVARDDPNDFGKGGYFKRTAIYLAYEFIVKELGLTIDAVAVFGGARTKSGQEIPEDKESVAIWKELGFDEKKIFKKGLEENFWGPTGDSGPCGPTTEIYINNVEIWNIVFNEFFFPGSRDELLYEDSDKKLAELKNPGVDTGMGLERLAAVLQGKKTVFETDLFSPIVSAIETLSQKSPSGFERQVRILADHSRAAFFLIADNVVPSNLDRGYILRRVIRRALLQARLLNLPQRAWTEPLIDATLEIYKNEYPEINNREKILSITNEELEKFEKAFEKSLKVFDKVSLNFPRRPGLFAFEMLQSHGLPLDLTKDLLLERKINFTERDEIDFYEAFGKHQKISKREEI